MQAIILCGGRGTRLASLYSDRPKILVPIAGRPFIEWQLEWLGRQGITDIHLAGGYRADVLTEWLRERGQGKPGNPVTLRLAHLTFHVSLSAEPGPLGTGGGLKYISPHVQGDQFLAINGDSISPELDFSRLVANHRETGAALTIAVAPIREAGRYGTVEFNQRARITAFREKSDRSNGWINAGVYAIQKRILDSIPDGKSVSLETEIFPALVEHGQLYAVCCRPPMLDMGTPEGIRALEEWLCAGGLERGASGAS